MTMVSTKPWPTCCNPKQCSAWHTRMKYHHHHHSFINFNLCGLIISSVTVDHIWRYILHFHFLNLQLFFHCPSYSYHRCDQLICPSTSGLVFLLSLLAEFCNLWATCPPLSIVVQQKLPTLWRGHLMRFYNLSLKESNMAILNMCLLIYSRMTRIRAFCFCSFFFREMLHTFSHFLAWQWKSPLEFGWITTEFWI